VDKKGQTNGENWILPTLPVQVAKRNRLHTILTVHDHWGFCFKNTLIKSEGEICTDTTKCEQCMAFIPDDGERRIPIRMRKDFITMQLEKVDAGEEIYQWILALRLGDGEAIGNIHFRPRAESAKGNRGFWLAEPYWNQGLMSEAIVAVNDFAFDTLGLESFYVCNAATNVASRRVKQKTGAEFVGYIELDHHDGQSRSERWRVTRENWRSMNRGRSVR